LIFKEILMSDDNSEKSKALQAALAQIEKQFGKGTIMRLGEGEVIADIQVVSTGSLGLDIALGVGGLPRGRVIEIYGPESSGKTTLTLQVISEMQRLGGTCAFVDAEHALDIQYAQNLGVNLQELLVSQPDTGEQALEIVDSLVRSGAVDLVVIDSVAALTPKAEIEGDMSFCARTRLWPARSKTKSANRWASVCSNRRLPHPRATELEQAGVSTLAQRPRLAAFEPARTLTHRAGTQTGTARRGARRVGQSAG
jgi:RecA/RadA recombinase